MSTITILYCTAVIPLLWIAISDALKRRIPIVPLIILLAIGFTKIAILGTASIIPAIAGFVFVGLPMLLVSCFLDHGNGIGGGDVKLCAVLGILLGTVSTFMLIALALIFLVVFALVQGGKKEEPFAPFVFLGYILIILLMILYGG